MRKINKGTEPLSFKNYKRRNSKQQYGEFKDTIVKQDICQACAIEQYFLCAYCCKAISGCLDKDTMNEHIQPRHYFPQLSMDFNNIVASCTTQGQCDSTKGSQILHLTPLMDECETELAFRLTGEVYGKTERAKDAIEILKLNNPKLCENRKRAIEGVLWNIHARSVENDELLADVIDEICMIDENGKMKAFAPIIVKVIRDWLNQVQAA